MANEPQWLKDYYGKDFDFLNPEIVKDGKKWALVKLSRRASKGYSSTGYVLIKKAGTHIASNYQSLHEGPVSQKDMDRMYAALAKEEANG